jgi:hypothetical protein
MGECEMRGEEVSGIHVHAAARVMAEAADGEVLLSGAVRDAISPAEFSTIDRGFHELKGVPGEWNLYALEPLSGDTTGWREATGRGRGSAPRRDADRPPGGWRRRAMARRQSARCETPGQATAASGAGWPSIVAAWAMSVSALVSAA